MNKTIKNALGIVGAVFAIILAGSAASYVNTYSKSIEPSSFRNFSVSAEGEAVGIPDVAEFTVGVVTEGGTNIGTLQDENTAKTNAIISFVKENGVEDKDVKTSWYDISPRYTTCYGDGICPPRQIVGYTISSSITVKMRDFSKTGDILSGVITKGANTVSSLTFKIDDEDATRKEARDKAISKAKIKAKELADSAGFKVGRLLSINEGYATPYYAAGAVMDSYYKEAALSSRTPVALEPGSQELTVTVTLTYEIK
ncbi:MAG: SIMPL domain-containing protein [Parcubacteria group bacterium]